ncbi:MAG: TfuA-related McrA-glycine thioamidation protein [Myxococcales bacterium]
MNGGIYVFLGPTLPVAQARSILSAEYLPPVTLGDVTRVTEKNPSAIAIIDGLFDQTPAVWHKEIMYALHKGIRVLGASSMGALRAAELHVFGMEGIGKVFEAYREGVLEDDDEVAVAHRLASGEFRVESEAMVNVRETLLRAQAAGVLSRTLEQRLCAIAKEMFYPDRTWRSILGSARMAGLPQEELAQLEKYVAASRADLKREDALELLHKLARERHTARPRVVPSFDFEPTVYWQDMRSEELLESELEELAGQLPPELEADQLRRHVRLSQALHTDMAREALLLFLSRREAERIGGPPPAEEWATRASALQQSAPSLQVANARRLAAAQLGLEKVLETQRVDLLSHFAVLLAERGLWESTIADARHKMRTLADLGLTEPSLEDAGIDLPGLMTWFAARYQVEVAEPEVHAWSLGFTTVNEFTSELLRQFLVERQVQLVP